MSDKWSDEFTSRNYLLFQLLASLDASAENLREVLLTA